MEHIFISDYFRLGDQLEKLGVFDAIINSDSSFYININRLKNTNVPQFKASYEKINNFFMEIVLLLDKSKEKGDRFYREALKNFNFHGVKSINLGHSKTGQDLGFGRTLANKTISDAYDIIKAGCKDPEIFHLVGLFEKNIAADRLSDMFATLIETDIREYTLWVNETLGINPGKYPKIEFKDGIAINKYKNCELLYVPKDILHEIPVARQWCDIEYVIDENNAIRNEINKIVGDKWEDYSSKRKKKFLLDNVFRNSEICRSVLEAYDNQTIEEYNVMNDMDYVCSFVLKKLKTKEFLNRPINWPWRNRTSWEVTLELLEIFKDFIENNKGWELIKDIKENKKEKAVQRIIHACGKYLFKETNMDMSFEPDEGRGPVDLKVSNGNDKTIIEIKLSSNPKYMHGYEKQIEEYARAEGCSQRIYVYIKNEDHPQRDTKIEQKYKDELRKGNNPPELFIIDAREKKSASIR